LPLAIAMILRSTTESIEKGNASCLAILESVLAVSAYWGIAWVFDTHAHLLASILVAPLLLLRSPESMELGVKWFSTYLLNHDGDRNSRTKSFLFFCTSILLGAIMMTSCTVENFSDNDSGCDMKFYIILLCNNLKYYIMYNSVIIFIAATFLLVSALFVGSIIIFFDGRFIVSTAFRAFSRFALIAFIFALFMVFTVVIYTISDNTVTEYTDTSDWAKFRQILAGVMLFAFSVIFYSTISVGSVALAVWLRSLFIRSFATLWCLPRGVKCISDNWYHTLVVIDSCHSPELVPGLGGQNNSLTLSSMVKSVVGEGYYGRLTSSYAHILWFIVALFYRWSLKSTCWLYLPLIYLAWPHKGLLNDDKVWLKELYCGRVERFRQFVALVVIASTILYTLPILKIFEVHYELPHAPAMAYLLAFDLKKIGALAPWQWCVLCNAVITVIVWQVSERLQFYLIECDDWKEKSIGRLRYIVRGRTIVSIISMTLALGFVILSFPKFYPADFPNWMRVDLEALPNWLRFIHWLYGPYLS
jgi:hypothetical protein